MMDDMVEVGSECFPARDLNLLFYYILGEDFRQELEQLRGDLDNLEATVLPPEDREKLQVAMDAFQPPSLDLGRVADDFTEGANSIWFFIKLAIR